MSLLMLFLPNPAPASPGTAVNSVPRAAVPHIKPKPYPYGLISVSNYLQVEDTDHRLGGIEWTNGVCSLQVNPSQVACSYLSPPGSMDPAGTEKFDPVDSTFAVDCSTFYSDDDSSPQTFNDELMTSVFGGIVEYEFQQGIVAQQYVQPNFFLNGPDTSILSGVGLHPADAIGQLIAQYRLCSPGDTGVIWATVEMVELWSSFGLIRNMGDHLETHTGAWVAAAIAFQGTADINGTPAPAGTQWAYITGRPTVIAGPTVMMTPEDLIRSENTNQALARKRWVMQLNQCCAMAVPVNLCYPACQASP